MYTVIDIETTGGAVHDNKIIEIAVICFDGEKITEEFQTLVNPGIWIPPYITYLTGITNDMVKGAPAFSEIKEKIKALTTEQIFVAHNVNFDYGFIKKEFEALGDSFDRKKLCTVRLSRKIIPGFSSYSLGTLSACLGINITDRHRAYGDAEATVKLLQILLEKDQEGHIEKSLKRNSMEATLPPNLPKEVFDGIPQKTGVYYFHNKKGTVIYVGKAKDIKKRVSGHFSGSSSREKQFFLENVYDITFELTGSELVALLEESKEIKRLWPEYNRVQKFTSKNYGLFTYEDQSGYLRVSVAKVSKGLTPVMSFRSFQEARMFLNSIVKEYRLCPKFCGLQKSTGACFNVLNGDCNGACKGEEPTDAYNERVLSAIKDINPTKQTLAIVGNGRHQDEQSVVLVEKGHYLGYGYIEKQQQIQSFDGLKEYIHHYEDNQDIQKILNTYLNHPNGDQIIRFQG